MFVSVFVPVSVSVFVFAILNCVSHLCTRLLVGHGWKIFHEALHDDLQVLTASSLHYASSHVNRHF